MDILPKAPQHSLKYPQCNWIYEPKTLAIIALGVDRETQIWIVYLLNIWTGTLPFKSFGCWSGVKAIWSAEYAGNEAASRVYLRGKIMWDASGEILFVRAKIYEEQSQSDPLFKRLFIQSEKKIHLHLYISIIFCAGECMFYNVCPSTAEFRTLYTNWLNNERTNERTN